MSFDKKVWVLKLDIVENLLKILLEAAKDNEVDRSYLVESISNLLQWVMDEKKDIK